MCYVIHLYNLKSSFVFFQNIFLKKKPHQQNISWCIEAVFNNYREVFSINKEPMCIINLISQWSLYRNVSFFVLTLWYRNIWFFLCLMFLQLIIWRLPFLYYFDETFIISTRKRWLYQDSIDTFSYIFILYPNLKYKNV